MTRGGSNAAAIWGLGVILLVALALRLWGLGKESLWLDEIIAATHAVQPLWRLPGEIIRWDMHPPVYFAQLALWSFAGDTDYVLLLNSVMWGLATVAVVAYAVWRLSGPSAAIAAAAFTAVAPGAIYMSQTLRMYALMSCVFVAIVYLYTNRIEILDRRLGWREILLPALLELVLILTHAIGFFHVFFLGLYAFVLCLINGRTRAEMGRVVGAHLLLAMTSLPVIVSSLLRSSASGVIDSLSQFLSALVSVVFTPAEALDPIHRALSGSLFVVAALLALLPGQRRRPIFWLLIFAPIVTNAAISLLFKPMFKAYVFAYAVPLVGWVLGSGLGELDKRSRSLYQRAAEVLVVVCVIGITFWSWTRYAERTLKPNDYRGAAAILAERVSEGDAIFAADDAGTFWALARYLVGPRWGSPHDFQSSDPNERWASVADRVPASLARYFGLTGGTNTLAYGKIPLIVGYGHEDGATAARYDRIWVVTYNRTRGRHEIPGFPPPTHRVKETIHLKGVTIERLEREAQ